MRPRKQNEQQPPRRRRRRLLSCVECRRRKVKCDRRDPCCHCELSKTPCVYAIKTCEGSSSVRATRTEPHAPAAQDSDSGLATEPNDDNATEKGQPQHVQLLAETGTETTDREPDQADLERRLTLLEQMTRSLAFIQARDGLGSECDGATEASCGAGSEGRVCLRRSRLNGAACSEGRDVRRKVSRWLGLD